MPQISSMVTMNRLTASQITASLAVLLLGTGGALMMGAGPLDILLPVLAALLVLAICAAGPDRAEPALSTMLAEVPDIVAHPDARDLMEAMADPLMLIERGRIVAANRAAQRSEEHTSELQSLMRTSYAVFCLKK